MALWIAIAGQGRFIDDEIEMLPGVHDPAVFIAQTRLIGAEGDFAARCERFMRQFPELDGWPRDRTIN